jgi:hypothetical protein
MKMQRQGLRLRVGLRVRSWSHESSVAVQKPDWSHRVKVSQSDFLNLRFTKDDLRGWG